MIENCMDCANSDVLKLRELWRARGRAGRCQSAAAMASHRNQLFGECMHSYVFALLRDLRRREGHKPSIEELSFILTRLHVLELQSI